MEPEDFIRIIQQNSGLRFIDINQTEIRHGFASAGTISFWYNGGWGLDCGFNPTDTSLKNFLSTFIRVEKLIGTDFFPIWTKEDGEILANEIIIKLNGRYYTAKYLEMLLNKVSELKELNL